jgi:superfamily II DNA or RNA helicase
MLARLVEGRELGGLVDLCAMGSMRAQLRGGLLSRARAAGLEYDKTGWYTVPPILVGQVLRSRWLPVARAVGLPVEDWRRWALRERATAPAAPPLDVAGAFPGLRAYQVEGVDWAASSGFTGLLGDDMGLGKTVQALAALELLRGRLRLKRTLIVVTSSVLLNWPKEARRWSPSVDVRAAATPKAICALADGGFEGAIVVTWGQLSKKIPRGMPWPKVLASLMRWAPDLLIADEAQYAKEFSSSRGAALMELSYPSRCRLLMTGTPMRNRPRELWTLLHIIDPVSYPAFKPFGDLYCGAVYRRYGTTVRATYKGATRKPELARKLAEVMLRRRKVDVLTELPDRTEHVRHFRASRDLRAGWTAVKVLMKQAKAAGETSPELLGAFMKAYQAAGLEKVRPALEIFDEVREAQEEPGPVIFLIHHAGVREALEAALVKRGLRVGVIVGATTPIQRQDIVDAVQAGEVDAFIGSQACKEGVTLTRASVVIQVERWWTYADEDQGVSRAHRFGQDRVVQWFFPHLSGSMDDYHARIVVEKKDLSLDIVDGRGLLLAMLDLEPS